MNPVIVDEDTDALVEDRTTELPPRAQEKMEARAEAALESRGRQEADRQAREALRHKKTETEVAIAFAEREKSRNGVAWGDADEARLEKQKARLAKYRAQLRPKQAEEPKLSGPAKRRARIVTELAPLVEPWLASHSPLATWVEKRAELPSGNLKKALDTCLAAEDAAIDRLVALEVEPLNLESVLAQADRDVDRLAKKGTPNVQPLTAFHIRHIDGKKSPGRIQWPTPDLYDQSLTNLDTNESGISFLCYLFGPQVKKKLKDDIRALYEAKGGEGISIADREREERELRARILELQRLQVRICDELGVQFRRVHPMALLEIERGPDKPRVSHHQPGGVEIKGGAPTLGVRFDTLAKFSAKGE